MGVLLEVSRESQSLKVYPCFSLATMSVLGRRHECGGTSQIQNADGVTGMQWWGLPHGYYFPSFRKVPSKNQDGRQDTLWYREKRGPELL